MQLHENEEKKEGENDNVVYADLDKSALGTGVKLNPRHFFPDFNFFFFFFSGTRRESAADKEATEYAEIKPQ